MASRRSAGWDTVIAPFSVIISFGIYPARKAAKMDPIAALRFE